MTVANRIRIDLGTWNAVINGGLTDPVNIGNIDHNANEADISAELQENITACITSLTDAGYQPVDLGSVTPPTQPPSETPPTADELTRDAEVNTAFNTVMDAEIARITDLVNTEYDLIKTTAELFLLKFDIKHLRQRAS